MANGASRLVLSEVALKGNSKSELYKGFDNENEVAKKKKVPLKNPSKHNHSK